MESKILTLKRESNELNLNNEEFMDLLRETNAYDDFSIWEGGYLCIDIDTLTDVIIAFNNNDIEGRYGDDDREVIDSNLHVLKVWLKEEKSEFLRVVIA
jgi:hypothetical protein